MSKSSSIKLMALGGLGEIGMNCLILESDKEIVVVDCGILFSDLEHFGIEFVVPDFSYLVSRKDKIKAFMVTHGHEDHIGALAFAFKAGLDAPIYASHFSSLLIREKFKEYGLIESTKVIVLKPKEKVEFEDFKIQVHSVNHSIVDAYALFIDTPVGKVIHTGDFKIDPLPFLGCGMDMNAFKEAGDQGVLLLLSDSTNAEHHEHSMSESIIYERFNQLFATAEGMVLVSLFASNVSRMGQIFDVAKKLGKKIVLSGRTMEQNVRLAVESGHLSQIESILINFDDFEKYDRKDLIVLSTGCQGEYRASLARIAYGEHKKIKLLPGDLVLMSSKFIPGNEKAIGRVINELFKQGANVLYEAIHDLHVSGHAARPELKKMLEAVRPRFFIPVHGEYRHLCHHVDIAKEVGLRDEQILIASNGDIVELSKDSCEVTDQIEETRVLVEDRDGSDISKLVLKDRRRLAETGVVFVLLVRNTEEDKIISGPEVILKGLVNEASESELIENSKKLVKKVVHNFSIDGGKSYYGDGLQETIRIELRRFFNETIGKKPTVLPIVLDL